MEIVISQTGAARAIYDETIDLAAVGSVSIRRASHVEPDQAGHWWADLAPVGGPRLGPFEQRSNALVVEQKWLEANWL